MKKYSIYALILVLALSLAACRMDSGSETTTRNTTNVPTTTPSIIPSMPTIETNIPDPSVDTGHLTDTEGVGGTGAGASDGTADTGTGNNGNANGITTGRSR